MRGITATPQGTDLLRVTQHRVREKQFINDHGTATAPWRAVNNFDELDAALGDIHYPAVLKTVSGGYDGHGQLVLRSDADLEKIRSRSDRGGGFPPSILEASSTSHSRLRFWSPATARTSSPSRLCVTSTATTSCI